MTERVEIANLALSWMGEKAITSLEDGTAISDLMKLNYIPARDAVMEAHDWSFAMQRFIPAKLDEDPVWGVGSAFKVPAEILRVVGCWPNSANAVNWTNTLLIDTEEQIDWVMEQGNILCDEEVVFAKGIMRIEKEGVYSPLFVHALAAKLGWLSSIAITADEGIFDRMAATYDHMIMEAKTRDGLQGRSRRIRQRSLRKVR